MMPDRGSESIKRTTRLKRRKPSSGAKKRAENNGRKVLPPAGLHRTKGQVRNKG
jgi:hypothetical protein